MFFCDIMHPRIVRSRICWWNSGLPGNRNFARPHTSNSDLFDRCCDRRRHQLTYCACVTSWKSRAPCSVIKEPSWAVRSSPYMSNWHYLVLAGWDVGRETDGQTDSQRWQCREYLTSWQDARSLLVRASALSFSCGKVDLSRLTASISDICTW